MLEVLYTILQVVNFPDVFQRNGISGRMEDWKNDYLNFPLFQIFFSFSYLILRLIHFPPFFHYSNIPIILILLFFPNS